MAIAVAPSESGGTGLWQAAEGDWKITAAVDDLNLVLEISEANNVSSANLSIPGGKVRAVPTIRN